MINYALFIAHVPVCFSNFDSNMSQTDTAVSPKLTDMTEIC